MTWHLTMFLTNALAFGALVVIMVGAPDNLKRVSLIIAGSGFLWVGACHFSAIVGYDIPDGIRHLGYMAGHFAWIIAVLRIFVVDQERRCLPNSSRLSRN